jgi:hypothetical protein
MPNELGAAGGGGLSRVCAYDLSDRADILALCYGKNLTLYDVPGNKLLRTIPVSLPELGTLAVSPDGGMVVFARQLRTIARKDLNAGYCLVRFEIYDTRTGKIIQTIQPSVQLAPGAFEPGDKVFPPQNATFITCEGGLRILLSDGFYRGQSRHELWTME